MLAGKTEALWLSSGLSTAMLGGGLQEWREAGDAEAGDHG